MEVVDDFWKSCPYFYHQNLPMNSLKRWPEIFSARIMLSIILKKMSIKKKWMITATYSSKKQYSPDTWEKWIIFFKHWTFLGLFLWICDTLGISFARFRGLLCFNDNTNTLLYTFQYFVLEWILVLQIHMTAFNI